MLAWNKNLNIFICIWAFTGFFINIHQSILISIAQNYVPANKSWSTQNWKYSLNAGLLEIYTRSYNKLGLIHKVYVDMERNS